jgi:hypothetical protein
MNGQDILRMIRQSAPAEFEKAVLACSVGFNLDDEIAESAILLVTGDLEFDAKKAIQVMKGTSFTECDEAGTWRICPMTTRRLMALELHRTLPNLWLPLQQLFADYCSRKSRALWPNQQWASESYDYDGVRARHLKEEECYHLLMIPERQLEAVTILRQMLETFPCPTEMARIIRLYVEDCQEHTDQIHPLTTELLITAISVEKR